MKICLNCGKSFSPKRETAKFCSDSCRTRYWLKNHLQQAPRKDSIQSSLRGVVEASAGLQDQSPGALMKKEIRLPNPDYEKLKQELREEQRCLEGNEKKGRELKEALENVRNINNNVGLVWGTGAGAFVANTFSSRTSSILMGAGIGGILASVLLYENEETREAKMKEAVQKIEESERINNIKRTYILARIGMIKKRLDSTNPFVVKFIDPSALIIKKLECKGSVAIPPPETCQEPDHRRVVVTENPVNTVSRKLINSRELGSLSFKSFDFKGDWLNFLGRPKVDFFCVIHGKPGQGKSTFGIAFARYLAENFGKTVYISAEEGISMTLRDKVVNNNALSEYLDIADLSSVEEIASTIPSDAFNFIFIDSLDKLRIGPEQMKQLRGRYKDSAIIAICQSTKDGRMRGSQEIAHDDDITISVESGVATTTKNRFKETGLIFKIFPGT